MAGRFEVYEVALEAACRLRPVLEALRRLDRGLEDQIRRAAASVVLNIAEGARRTGRDRLHLYRIAAGSAAETRSALGLAWAWGYLDEGVWMELDPLLDRVLAMLWMLTHPRR